MLYWCNILNHFNLKVIGAICHLIIFTLFVLRLLKFSSENTELIWRRRRYWHKRWQRLQIFRAGGARDQMLPRLRGKTDDNNQKRKLYGSYELLHLILTHAVTYSILLINIKLMLNNFSTKFYHSTIFFMQWTFGCLVVVTIF